MIADIARRILGLSGWAALAVVFAGPMLESAAFVGFIFPGEIAVLLGGVLASQHRISLAGALVAASGGAVLGDAIGYAVGRRYGRVYWMASWAGWLNPSASTAASGIWLSGAVRRCSSAGSPPPCVS